MKVKAAEFSDNLPFLTITSEHNITVLGKNLSEAEGSSSYKEFSSLRFNSRPGDAGSFFAKAANGPLIPAVLDTKNDRGYALQQGNNRLTCWNSWKSSGPDDKSALKAHLDHPALSMKLLPMSKGIVYGTCQNGMIYVARVIGGNISVEYIQVKQPKGAVHIGTFAEIEVDQAKTSGRKRKMSDADGNSSVNFYQVFLDGASITILRNNVSLSVSNADKLIKSGSLVQNTASVGLLNEELSNEYALGEVQLLVSSSGSAPKISIVYMVNKTSNGTIKNEDARCGTFCVAISLANGQVSNSPVRLSSNTNQFGLVTETVLAAASSDTIYLYDLVTGATLQSNSLKRVFRDMDGEAEWVLHSNDKHGILAIFYEKEDHLQVALSTASLDDGKVGLSSNTLKSSSKLACSLLSSSKENVRYAMIRDKDANSSSSLIRLDDSVTIALTELEETRKSLVSSKNGSKTSFRKAFDASVSTLMSDVNSSIQDGATKTNGKLNGKHQSSSSTKTDGGKIPATIPQSFIDGSVKIALSIILGSRTEKRASQLRLDAHDILKDLIQTKRVSARLHLEGSYALQETGKEHPLAATLRSLYEPSIENPLSALQLIIEMIVNCSDLSERQLVVMLDYMMRHAKADGIVDTVRSHNMENGSTFKMPIRDEKQTLIAGLKAVLQMVVGYSECNEAMLRVALREELSSSAEAIVLARMLPKLLVANPYSSRTDHFVGSACQWITALSESFRDDLSWAKASSGSNYLSLLLNAVENVTKNSQAVMSLKDSIGAAEMAKKQKKSHARKGFIDAPQMEEMWGYSIDHIIF